MGMGDPLQRSIEVRQRPVGYGSDDRKRDHRCTQSAANTAFDMTHRITGSTALIDRING